MWKPPPAMDYEKIMPSLGMYASRKKCSQEETDCHLLPISHVNWRINPSKNYHKKQNPLHICSHIQSFICMCIHTHSYIRRYTYIRMYVQYSHTNKYYILEHWSYFATQNKVGVGSRKQTSIEHFLQHAKVL